MNGFSSMTFERFLITTNNAMTAAGEVHDRNPFEGVTSVNVPLPSVNIGRNQSHPFSPDEAIGGRHPVGIGSHTNVVIDQGVYENALRRADVMEDQLGEEIYKTAMAIEKMCTSIYIVPETVPKILALTEQVKSSLGQFRALTEDASIQTRKYINEIMQLDQGSGNIAVSERVAHNVMRNVSSAANRQGDNMRNTARGFSSTAQSLTRTANSLHNQANGLLGRADELNNSLSNPVWRRFGY